MSYGPRNPDLEAEIYLLTMEEGGRRSGVTSGYRPDHNFERKAPGELNGALHEYPDGGTLDLGETKHARLWLLAPEMNEGRLYEGMEFTAQEGARVVARGRITRVLTPALRRVV
ncbi:MAG: hypothetical protein Rubg2KO_26230 [Rubricoccaceae bacterium]